MEFLNKIFDERDKPIGESSRKLYTRNLMKLNNDMPITSFDFLKQPKNILNMIKYYKPTTQRSYIIAICTVLKNSKQQNIYDMYFEILSNFNNQLKVNTDKSENQEKNWLSNDNINKISDELKSKVVKKVRNKEDYTTMLNYMILSLYTLHVPRRNIDYSLMKLSNNMNDDKFNYLDMDKKQFIFNNYKTQGKYNSVVVPIEDELMKVISLYLKNHPEKGKLKNKNYNVHFLKTFYNEDIIKSQDMTRILNMIFSKNVGSSMLRNLYLTNKYGGMVEELKKDTTDMGTSVDVALNNYIKKD
jgi:hypothetical protein